MSLLVEQLQMVLAQPPWDMSSVASASDYVCLKDYHHVAIVFLKHVGTASDDPTITVQQANTTSGGDVKELYFTKVWKKQGLVLTATGTFTAVTQTSANTFTHTDLAEQQAIVVIEFDSSELDTDNGFDCIRATVADVGSNAQNGCILYLLSEPRYAQATLPSAL
jgi:hypothetical protein